MLAGAIYPFWIYVMLDHASPALLMAPLAALWLARVLLARSSQPGGRVLPVLALIFCAALAWADSQQGLRAYPVLVSAMGLAIFAASLWRGPPVIERIARLRHPDLPPQGVRYTRRVTQIWCVFFLFNGGIATALGLWAPWSWWTLYNGLISYLLIGLLMVGEWLVRPAMGRAP